MQKKVTVTKQLCKYSTVLYMFVFFGQFFLLYTIKLCNVGPLVYVIHLCQNVRLQNISAYIQFGKHCHLNVTPIYWLPTSSGHMRKHNKTEGYLLNKGFTVAFLLISFCILFDLNWKFIQIFFIWRNCISMTLDTTQIVSKH